VLLLIPLPDCKEILIIVPTPFCMKIVCTIFYDDADAFDFLFITESRNIVHSITFAQQTFTQPNITVVAAHVCDVLVNTSFKALMLFNRVTSFERRGRLIRRMLYNCCCFRCQDLGWGQELSASLYPRSWQQHHINWIRVLKKFILKK